METIFKQTTLLSNCSQPKLLYNVLCQHITSLIGEENIGIVLLFEKHHSGLLSPKVIIPHVYLAAKLI